MKTTTVYLCLISIGVAVGIVSVVEGVTWLAAVAWLMAYAAAGAYRWETRRQKGARR